MTLNKGLHLSCGRSYAGVETRLFKFLMAMIDRTGKGAFDAPSRHRLTFRVEKIVEEIELTPGRANEGLVAD